MSILHAYNQTVADGTATSVVRPSDWNSAHNQVLNLGGNTAGTSQVSGSDIVWAGGNNVTLSANGSTVSVVGPSLTAYLTTAQPPGAYLTTAAQSNHSHNLATTTTNGAVAVVATTNSAGATIAFPSWLTTAGATNAITTAAQSNHSHAFATTTTNGSVAVVATSNSNGVTLANPAWITTYAAQTNQTAASGNIAGVGTTFAGTNVTATMALNSVGLALSLSAGAGGGGADGYNSAQFTNSTANSTMPLVWAGNSNGSGNVTIGLTGSTITMSAPSGGGGGVAVIAGNATYTSGTVVISGSGGVTVTNNGQTAIISFDGHHMDGILPSGNNYGTGFSSMSTGTFGINAVGALSMSQNANNLSLSVPAQTVDTNKAGVGYSSTTQAGSTVGVTQNTAGLSMAWPPFLTTAQSAGAYLTTAAQSNHSHNFATTTTGGSNIVVGTANSAGATIGVPAFITTYVNDLTSGRAGLGTTFAGTNASASMTVNTAGLNLALSVAAGGGLTSGNIYVGGNTLTGGYATSGAASLSSQGYVFAGNISGGISNYGAGDYLIVYGAGGTTNQTGPNIAVAGSTVTSGNVYFSNSPTVTFGMAGSTITASAAGGGGALPLYLSYQNRQLGASGSTQFTNNQLWMMPFRVAGGSISASTLQFMQSIGGTYTSAVAATHAETMKWCIYGQNSAALSQMDSLSSGSLTWQVWNSGTSSGSWAMNGSTSSSAGTGIFTQISGVRMLDIPLGTTIGTGLYMLALAGSTSSAGYSALVSRYGVVVDNPMPLALGLRFGSAVATSIGYGDAGTYSVISAAFPATVSLSQVLQHSNLVPYFKIGAL